MTADQSLPRPGDQSVAAQWARWRTLSADLNERSVEAGEDEWDRLSDLESFVLKAPVQTKADAHAKLQAVLRSFYDGDRGDGADRGAICQVICWLGRE